VVADRGAAAAECADLRAGGEMASSTLGEVFFASPLLRVADRDRTVEWFRTVLGLEPLVVGSDGAAHPFAVFAIGGMTFAVWQLPPGVVRSRDENDRNTYLVLTHPDPARAHAELVAAGADVGRLSESEHHTFFWFHDPDGNRYEIASPPKP
jgi:catechol 2,3-dioxygenase-like lactoylglutathione lyase family enzyme